MPARASSPVLVFLEDFPRDADAQRFAKSLSDYVDGNFRVKFSSASELADQIDRSLRAMSATHEKQTMDHDLIAAHLLKPHRFSDQTSLRFAITPERVEEVFDPLDLASPDFAERMMEIGHRRDVRLFGYLYAKEPPRLEQDWLVIEQPLGNNWSDGRQGVRLAIRRGEQGIGQDAVHFYRATTLGQCVLPRRGGGVPCGRGGDRSATVMASSGAHNAADPCRRSHTTYADLSRYWRVDDRRCRGDGRQHRGRRARFPLYSQMQICLIQWELCIFRPFPLTVLLSASLTDIHNQFHLPKQTPPRRRGNSSFNIGRYCVNDRKAIGLE